MHYECACAKSMQMKGGLLNVFDPNWMRQLENEKTDGKSTGYKW